MRHLLENLWLLLLDKQRQRLQQRQQMLLRQRQQMLLRQLLLLIKHNKPHLLTKHNKPQLEHLLRLVLRVL
jgi:hypothetical protein